MIVWKAGEIQLHWSTWEKGNCAFWYLLRQTSWLLIKSLFTENKRKNMDDSTDMGEICYLVVTSTLAGSLTYPNV